MSDINLITPPDKLYSRNSSVLLINPSEGLRLELQNLLQNTKQYFDIYLYEVNTDNHEFTWLLDVHRMVTWCILELENLPPKIKKIESYLISFGNTYYITQGEDILFNLISNNKIYSLDQLKDILRG
jgi:hypothetical protein